MARMRTVQGTLRLLAADAAGSLLPIAAITLILLASLIGGGIDMSRAYQVKNRLQYACDAGVLAGRKAVEAGYDTNVENQTAVRNQAAAFFNGNFDEGIESASDTSFTTTSPDEGNTIEGTATTNVDTVVMRIFGFDSIALSATCRASMSVGNSDVMMVLDVTGSMACTAAMSASECSSYIAWNGYDEDNHGGSSRLLDLELAMKAFFDTVAAATQNSTARIRYGFVPYSSSVNVGRLLDPSWLVDSYTVQTRLPQFDRTEVDETVGWEEPVHTTDSGIRNTSDDDDDWSRYSQDNYSNRDACEAAMPADSAWQNDGGPEDDYVKYTNEDGQQVEIFSTVQRQSSSDYECLKTGFWIWTYYYIAHSTRYQEIYSSDIYTSDPIIETVVQEEFTHFEYKQDTYPTYRDAPNLVTLYKTFNTVSVDVGEGGEAVTSTWDGCIEERKSVSASSFSFSKLLGISPSDAWDLDLDSLPEADDDDTKWRPMWPEVAYYRTNSSGNRLSSSGKTFHGRKAGSYCPHQAQLLLDEDEGMDQDGFYAYAESLKPTGATYHDIGMIWGGRLSSPDGLFADHVTEDPANGGAVARHLIFMTDGEMAPNNDIQSAYGIEWHDWRVTDDGSSSQRARHNSRFRAVCEAIKAKGIRIWVIAFATGLSNDLEECASDDSAFPAKNAAELNTAFMEIAKDVGELRIVQ